MITKGELSIESKKQSFYSKAVNDISSTNLLVDIPLTVRIGIIIYFFLYQFYFPIRLIVENSGGFEYVLLRIIKILNDFLLLVPIMFKWKGVGLLHPFVWSNLFDIAKTFKQPERFIAPFLSSNGVITQQAVIPSPGLSPEMKLALLSTAALLCTYLGYFITKKQKIDLKYKLPSPAIRDRIVMWAFICSAIALGFFLSRGGLQAWINSWGLAGSRSAAMEGFGPILAFVGGLYYIPTLWILSRNKAALRDPFFWLFAVVFAFCSFLATGSRYGILQALTTYLMAWVLLNKDFPFVKVILGGFIFLILFGVLGKLRTSATHNKSEADWSVLNEDISSYLEYSSTEVEKRSKEKPDVKIIRRVPEEVDYLYGTSYLYLIATYVPRALWADKPHSGAYYTGYRIFNVNWSIPPSEIGEVYFNFGTLGLLLFFIMKGCVFKIFVNSFRRYHKYAGAAMIYFMFVFTAGSFSSLGLGDFLREVVFVLVGLKFLRLL
ncbi:hypothetical protein DJ568_01940 [Mucilaginibacter hurinus]|uniref:Oligosaccharide repeat unit polymerase n=1 Tax=Mucilaginibacter hurinus TaxID=2201324 RepID=A0A367GUA1_9SPHI|nr:O-antigen polymerase [Mucilaginibacter hurinus]RCH56645.1 hypothetical protein DJ568_01940 [Mucilaginibacter hurinus]